MSRLWKYHKRFGRHKQTLIPGLLAVPLVVASEIALTVIIGKSLTRLRAGEDDDFLAGVFALLLLVAAASAVFRFFQRWFIVGVSRRFEVELKQEIFDKLGRLPLAFHASSRSGDIVSRLTSDVENLRMLLGPGLLMYVFTALCMVPGAMIVLLGISPSITISMAIPLLFAGLAMKMLTPRLHAASVDVQESLGDLSHRAQESFAGMRVVKGYGLSAHEERDFEAVSASNRTHQIQMASARGTLHCLVYLAYDMAFLPILFVGGLGMIDRSIDVGQLFMFIDLGVKVFWPVIALGWIAGLYPRAIASMERIDDILGEADEVEEAAHPVRLTELAGALELRDVSHTYANAPRPALSGINIEIPSASTLGVVGPTGSGKSTLLNLIGRLFEFQGEIRLDGVPLRNIPLETLRGALAFVPQDSFLFSETYRANIEFGADGELDDAQLARLIELAGMTEEVAGFPNGAEQIIGERGVTLSGGQRQRTCIARALAKDARILILDDALSAVDTETEVRLKRSLREAGADRTVILSAHRLATVRDADNIVALKDGRIDAQGSHEELLERSDWYRETWDHQRMQDELEGLS